MAPSGPRATGPCLPLWVPLGAAPWGSQLAQAGLLLSEDWEPGGPWPRPEEASPASLALGSHPALRELQGKRCLGPAAHPVGLGRAAGWRESGGVSGKSGPGNKTGSELRAGV